MKKSTENDPMRISHMLDFARKLVEYTAAKSRDDLEPYGVLALALTHLIELFGESASQVSDETRATHPQIPWRIIVDTRNRVIHGYIDVDLDQIWVTATEDIPPLIPELEAILSVDDSGKSK